MVYKTLPGLKISEFIHPEEQEKGKILSNAASRKVFEHLNDLCQKVMQPLLDGVYIQVTESSMPYLYSILKNVCLILDYREPLPVICICRNYCSAVVPCGCDQNYMVVSEYIIRSFDESMLYYTFGNAVTMLKAGHVKYANIAAFVPGAGPFEIIKKPFTDFLHAADATSDRGGLLACQCFAAALRCCLLELGFPVEESRCLFESDLQALDFAGQYLSKVDSVRSLNATVITKAARVWHDISYIEGPGNLMLRDLYTWYISPDGYRTVMRNHTGRLLETKIVP